MLFPRLLAVTIFAFACSKSAPTTTTPIKDPVPMTEGSSTAPSSTRATATLAAYERVRMLLAADEMRGLPEAAREIETAAKDAGYGAVATSAAALAATKDIDAARDSFGALSRDVVAVLVADKSLATGLHIYECPMVKGYRKWVQPSEDMANPYMGKKMLACGGESSWQ